MFTKPQKQAGVTLIELIIALVIIGVALAGIASAMTTMIRRSADPAIAQQEIAIANAYMGEIAGKIFGVPNTINGDPCNSKVAYPTRSNRTHTCQYDGLLDQNQANGGSGPLDQYGNALGLNAYSVAVTVVSAGADLAITAADAVRISVTVTGPNGSSFTLVGYRTNYG